MSDEEANSNGGTNLRVYRFHKKEMSIDKTMDYNKQSDATPTLSATIIRHPDNLHIMQFPQPSLPLPIPHHFNGWPLFGYPFSPLNPLALISQPYFGNYFAPELLNNSAMLKFPLMPQAPSPDIIRVKRRTNMIFDSDSEQEANGSRNGVVRALEFDASTSADPVATLPKERDQHVRFLIKSFPSIPSFEIYSTYSNNNFNVNDATAELMTRTRTTGISYANNHSNGSANGLPLLANGSTERIPVLLKRSHPDSSQSKSSKVKRRRTNNGYDSDDSGGEYKNQKRHVFDSDEDSDTEITTNVTPERRRVLEFLQTATSNELLLMPSCSKKKVDALIASRPFIGWIDLVEKLQTNKNLSTDLLNSAQRVLMTRNNIKLLMKKCGDIKNQLEYAIKSNAGLKTQPSNLTASFKLTPYQLIGLNWLVLLQQQGLNGILADEMGLGKTVQIIAFLAHLKLTNKSVNTHLVIVPASTLENWQNEFTRWCPSLRVLLYYGNIDERRGYRVMFANGRHRDFDVILTTYSMVSTSPEERKMFRVTPMHYVIFDEAHMLKNMNTQRFDTLFRVRASRRILLTGTPLQNNLLELMSLLTFLMPNIFSEKIEDLKSLFQKNLKKDTEQEPVTFEREQIEQAKQIMKPFVLRRLKSDVLQDLPPKKDYKLTVPLSSIQQQYYTDIVAYFKEAGQRDDIGRYNGMSMMSDLRKLSNHPVLLRYYFNYETDLPKIAKLLAADPRYKDTVVKYIIDDLACMSDFEIHTMAKQYPCLSTFQLPQELILKSGKFEFLDNKLAELKTNGHRVLIFSQYVIMLDVMEQYMKIRKHSYLRLDGSTAVTQRQQLIEEYSNNPSIFIFLLSTRAGGLGINLTAADTVIIHDIDFNPYNDKQAEDRCHRMGQTKPVNVYRLVSEGTIEEGMWSLTQEKLKLEKEITSEEYENTETKSAVTLLSSILGIDTNKAAHLVTPEKGRKL